MTCTYTKWCSEFNFYQSGPSFLIIFIIFSFFIDFYDFAFCFLGNLTHFPPFILIVSFTLHTPYQVPYLPFTPEHRQSNSNIMGMIHHTQYTTGHVKPYTDLHRLMNLVIVDSAFNLIVTMATVLYLNTNQPLPTTSRIQQNLFQFSNQGN